MNMALFDLYWIMFSILVLIASSIAFFWALRKGLFRDQERARYLALWAEVPEEEKSSPLRTQGTQRKAAS